MSNNTVSLSPGEWQIMDRLWEKTPRTLMELVRILAPDTGWSKSTIATMITRLEAKGAITCTGDRVPAAAGLPGQRGDDGQYFGRRPGPHTVRYR